jgi:hypothetical protein
MSRKDKDQTIERARLADSRRGKRPIDFETLDERRRRKAALQVIVDFGTEEDLKAFMRKRGLSEESHEWHEALRIWHAREPQ